MKYPATPTALLASLKSRGVEVSVQKTVRIGPRGHAVPCRHLWAHGPVCCTDWEAIRRHREGLIALLERQGAEDCVALPPPAEMAAMMLTHPSLSCRPRMERGMARRAGAVAR